MAYEDIDLGDETRRNGDEVGFPHPDADGTELSNITHDRGTPVAYDGSNIVAVTGDGTDDPVGVVKNYDVYGDTGQEKISDNDVTVKTRGPVKADLTVYADGAATVSVGSYVDDSNTLYVSEAIDAGNNIYEVFVR